MLVDFNVMNEFNAYLVKSMTSSGQDDATEEIVMRHVAEFASIKRIDPMTLFRSFLVYLTLIELQNQGVLTEAIDDLEDEFDFEEMAMNPSNVN